MQNISKIILQIQLGLLITIPVFSVLFVAINGMYVEGHEVIFAYAALGFAFFSIIQTIILFTIRGDVSLSKVFTIIISLLGLYVFFSIVMSLIFPFYNSCYGGCPSPDWFHIPGSAILENLTL